MKYLLLIGRCLYSLIFIVSGFNHFNRETIAYASQNNVPAPDILVPLSGLLIIIGGMSITLGLKAKIGSLLIILFLIPVTLYMHHFWNINRPEEHTLQLVMFMKNLSMLGSAFIILYFGSGPLSLDSFSEYRSSPKIK
ncbi:MAG: DoxX family protein [Bacteriovoracaceae bacterium]